MRDAAMQEQDSFAETPELHERIDRVGYALLGGATVMFFLGFVFAYFYLRSLDTNELWRPAGVSPPTGYGIAIAASLALSAFAFGYAARVAKRGDGGWVRLTGVALALGLFACVAQMVEYAHIPFGPQSGGYASVFFGWTALYVVATLLSLYRLETVFALGVRHRDHPEKMPEGFAPSAYYWALLAGIGILAWIVLYLV
ncbi:MAG: cytochrome c oxidase subunit 3 [Solirubrobacterales bacterium]